MKADVERLAGVVSDRLQSDVTATDCPGIVRAFLAALRELDDDAIFAGSEFTYAAHSAWLAIIDHLMDETQ